MGTVLLQYVQLITVVNDSDENDSEIVEEAERGAYTLNTYSMYLLGASPKVRIREFIGGGAGRIRKHSPYYRNQVL